MTATLFLLLWVFSDRGRWCTSSDEGGSAWRGVAAPWQCGNMRLPGPTGSHRRLRRQYACTDATYNGCRRVRPTSIEEKWVPINRPGARPPPEKKVIPSGLRGGERANFLWALGTLRENAGNWLSVTYIGIHTYTHRAVESDILWSNGKNGHNSRLQARSRWSDLALYFWRIF